MHYLDIIIFAAVAVFLFVRLWSVLGQRDDDERQRPNPFVSPPQTHDDEDVMVLPDRAKALPSPQITAEGHAAASLAGVMDQIRTLDPSFDEKVFLQGARAAFTRVVEAFAQGDLSRVARILAPSVHDGFQQAIEARRTAGETLESRVDRVTGADVVKARLEGSRAILTVEFVSNQINITRDAKGNVISGTPGKAEEIRDMWVFARDMKSPDPNWQLIETQS